MSIQTSVTTDAQFYQRARRNFIYALPLYVLVPVAFWYFFNATGVSLRWSAFGLGALGWIVALVLRTPIGLLIKGMSKNIGQVVMASVSGPLEEGVRLVLLLLTSITFGWSASVGQGWAAIELVYAVVNGFVISALLTRTDDKSTQVKEALEQQFGGQKTTNPLYGVLERIFASAFHIGCAILIAYQPWWAIVTMVLHSGFNLAVMQVARRAARLASLVSGFVGSAVFIVSLWVWQ